MRTHADDELLKLTSVPRVAQLEDGYLGCGAARSGPPMNRLAFISALLFAVLVLAKTNPRAMLTRRSKGRRWNGEVNEGYDQQLAGRLYPSKNQRPVPRLTRPRKSAAPASEEWEEFGEDV